MINDSHQSNYSSFTSSNGNTESSQAEDGTKIAFWKDINTKDEDYNQAIIIRKREREDSIRKRKKKRRHIKEITSKDANRITLMKNTLRIQETQGFINTDAVESYA